MKKISILVVFVLVIAFASFVSAQSTASAKAGFPKGARVLSKVDHDRIVQQIEAPAYRSVIESGSNAANADGTGRPPHFAITVTGDSVSGITSRAVQTRKLNAGTVIIGARKGTTGNAVNLQSWVMDEDIPAGSVWYDIENSKKTTWTEIGGIHESRMIVIEDGEVSVYRAQKEINNFYGPPASSIIRDGYAGYDETGEPHFYLFGKFGSGKVGVVLKHIDKDFTVFVPQNAVELNNFVDIKLGSVEYGLPYGDYAVTIANKTGLSDTFILRYGPSGTAPPDELASRVKASAAKYPNN